MSFLQASRRDHMARWSLSFLFILSATLAPWLGSATAQAGALADKPAPNKSASSAAVTIPRFGLAAPSGIDQNSANAIRDSGAALVLIYVSWEDIEPVNTTPDQYNLSSVDRVLGLAANAGVQPVLTVGGCPAWACPDVNGPVNSANMSDYIELMTTLVQRYSQPQYNVHHWEIFNEPDASPNSNHSVGFGGSPAKYVELLRTISPIIKQLDATAVVAMGGLAYDFFWTDGGPFNRDFLAGFLAAGGAQYTDYIGFHFYSFNVHWGADIKAKTAEIRAILARYNYTGPLLCNEFGQPSAGADGFNEATQAAYLVTKYAQAISVGLQGLIWFTARDYGASNDLFAVSGILRSDGSRKPSFLAYQNMTHALGESAYLGPITNLVTGPSTLDGAVFAGANGAPIAVVWNNSGDTATATMRSRDVVAVQDLYGQQVNPTFDGNGNVILPTSSTPYYVELTATAGACARGFSDVQTSDYFYGYVLHLSCNGVISGYSDGTFRPYSNATRGQLAKIVVGAEGWALDTSAGPHFRDVPNSNAFYPFVETAYKHGVISGYGDGTFRPGDSVTRGQLSKIIVLSANWAIDAGGEPHFSDTPASSPFYQFVETAWRRGIIAGYADGAFRPNAAVTRGQLAKIVVLAKGWTTSDLADGHFVDVSRNNPFYAFIETAFAKGLVSGYSDNTFRPDSSSTRGQIARIVYQALTTP